MQPVPPHFLLACKPAAAALAAALAYFGAKHRGDGVRHSGTLGSLPVTGTDRIRAPLVTYLEPTAAIPLPIESSDVARRQNARTLVDPPLTIGVRHEPHRRRFA